MRALSVVPGRAESACLIDTAEPSSADRTLLVQTLAIGICGTDREILSGSYGWAVPGSDRLIIGHESIGRVLDAPPGSGLASGDLVVGFVRRPDPVPCPYCEAGEWDMCRNGLYTECGIKQRDGYGAERFRLEPDFALKIDPSLGALGVLIEPASVVAKAWCHADRIGHRASGWRPSTVLVTGAGPVGLLAALMGRQRGLDVHVFDRVTQGRKPTLVRDLGATYHTRPLSALDAFAPDLIMECTGAASIVADVVTRSAPAGIVCLTGVSSGGHRISLDLGSVNRHIVIENDVIFGSVNANRSHYAAAAAALAAADRDWLSRLITRRVPLDRWRDALALQADDVKVVIEFASES